MTANGADAAVEGVKGDRVVDIHAHHVSPVVVDEARRNGASYGVRVELDKEGRERLSFVDGITVRPFFDALLDLDDRIVKMDEAGVDVQVISTWTDLAGYELPPAPAARWARLQNEGLAEAASRYPARLRAMGTLPLPNVAEACREMRYAVETLGMRSFVVCTHVAGRDLDGEELWPLWSLACDLDVLLFLHPPARQIGFERLSPCFLNNLVGNPTETTIAAARLIFGGVARAFPAMKVLLAHGGGFLPYQAGRLDHGHTVVPDARRRLKQAPSSYLSWFFYDSVVFDDRALLYLCDVVSADRVVLGSDYPFEMCDTAAVARVRRIGLRPDARKAVLGGTSEALLKYPSTARRSLPAGLVSAHRDPVVSPQDREQGAIR